MDSVNLSAVYHAKKITIYMNMYISENTYKLKGFALLSEFFPDAMHNL